METVLHEYEIMKNQIEDERNKFQEERIYKDEYIDTLEKTNHHLESQNLDINDELQALRDEYDTQFNEQNLKDRKSEAKKARDHEKVVS